MTEKKLRKYLIPNILAMVGISCYILADTFFISKAAGANGITALNLTLPVFGMMFALGSMIGIGSATRYNLCKLMSRKNTEQFFSNAVIWSLIVSMIFVLAGIICPDTILRLMGADSSILNTGLPYIRTVLMFAPFFMLNYTFTSFVRNDGAPGIAMAATLSSSFFNIIFDYIFMFPMEMGMTGAALATGISPIVSMAVCMIHFLSKKNTIRFMIKLPSVRMLILSCSLGIAGFIGEISSAVTSMAFNFILLDIRGNIAVAAYGAIANVALVGIAIFNGIGQGLQPMASDAEGSKNEDAKRRIHRHSQQIGLAISCFLMILIWIFAERIVGIFNSENSKEMAELAVTGIRLYSIGFPLAAMNIIRAGFLSATGRAKECFIISVSRGIAAIIFFAFVLSILFRIYGVWLAFPAAELLTLIFSMFMQKKSTQKV
ncbi:MAG: polysaccharide biosynthesis C-terminal domain-containing protein [Ruminococcus sp.]|nr:polysaccharide biosynthesis C-terminal domain-containing protein [Ruminococcus sp.]